MTESKNETAQVISMKSAWLTSRKISKQEDFLVINQQIFKSSQKNKRSILSKEDITEIKILL